MFTLLSNTMLLIKIYSESSEAPVDYILVADGDLAST